MELNIENTGVVMMQQIVPFLYLAAGVWIAAFLGILKQPVLFIL